ncbi:MAG TPA: acyltransferase family protein [Gemmata sp.]
MSAPPISDRYHALDSLRGFAMFLGIALHGAISFMEHPPAFWPVRDADSVPVADVFLIGTHDFRMQLFFLLAGFFGCLLYQRYGLGGFLKHRARRVLIPFALALLFIAPTVQAAGLYAEIANVRAESVRGKPSPARGVAANLVAANPDASAARLVWDRAIAGAMFERFPFLHLWFLYYLLLFVVAVLLLAPVLGRLTGTRLLVKVDRAFRWVIQGPGRVLIPALLTFPLMLPMKWVVDTPERWNPQWHIVGYYFAFFGFGWMLFRHRDLVGTFGRRCWLHLALANMVLLPALVGLIVTGYSAEQAGHPAPPGMKLGAYAVSVLYTWLMITGLWGAFLRLFTRPSAWVRYLADSAYWCYLASITPIFIFQFVVRDWPLPAVLKFVLVTVATMALLLLSYEWGVRYTFIGAVLNGRKHRTRAPHDPAPAPPEPAMANARG